MIDDGSSDKSQAIFDTLAAMPKVQVLHHPVNKGKGAALKTGYTYIKEQMPEVTAILTADSDGQHTVEDCVRLCEAVATGERGLYLGSRDFSLPEIPPKSRFGNRCTSVVFKALYGTWLPDTQTGLRGFRREDLEMMLAVSGERYEYEMNVLIAASRAKLPFKIITIKTVYENNNAGTHFHPIRDSWRIYKVLLGGFLKFAGSSLFCWSVDQILAAVLADVFLPLVGVARNSMEAIQGSGYGARVVSALMNYCINRKVVFKDSGNFAQSLWKYIVLAICVISLSNLAVWGMTQLTIPRWIAKIVADMVLYFVNFNFQNRWVFAKGKE